MTHSVLRRADCASLDGGLTLLDDPIGDFLDHLFEQHPQMRVRAIIGGRDVFNAIGVGRKLITFLETDALRIVRVVNRDGYRAALC